MGRSLEEGHAVFLLCSQGCRNIEALQLSFFLPPPSPARARLSQHYQPTAGAVVHCVNSPSSPPIARGAQPPARPH
eukprot:12503462-Alexandrium_andersonii.AAC.1